MKTLKECLHLPDDASEEQVGVRLTEMLAEAAKAKFYKERSEAYEKQLSEAVRKVEDAEQVKKEAQLQKANLFVEEAERKQIVDKSEHDFWVGRFIEAETETTRLFENRKYSVLSKRLSVAGDGEAPKDPVAEAAARVAEMIANDRSKTLTEPQAYSRLWAEDPKLWERVTEARREKSSKGGEG